MRKDETKGRKRAARRLYAVRVEVRGNGSLADDTMWQRMAVADGPGSCDEATQLCKVQDAMRYELC